MGRRFAARGTWPGAVVLKSGWDRAYARPLDDDTLDASLRIERGSGVFLVECVSWIFAQGAEAVVSNPLAHGSLDAWLSAGFRPHRELVLMERDLSFPVPPPSLPARKGSVADLPRVAEVDGAAFAPGWRMGRIGITEALKATVDSALLVTESADGDVSGFAIVGTASPVGYLQRIAVDPRLQSQGIGRSLVRVSLGWAKSHGANTMILNTQPDNAGAIALYLSERFEVLRERLLLVRAERGSWRVPTGAS